MSTAAATPAVEAPSKGSKKKLIMIVAALLVLALVGGGAAMLLLKKKAAAEDDAEEPAAAAHSPVTAAAAKHDSSPPIFVPLDPFTVNLADKDAERYAQVAVTLQITDAHFADQLKLYMPAIRNNILMVLAHKTAAELLTRDGKTKLASQILRESLRPLGFEVEADGEDDDEPEPAAVATAKSKKKKAKRKAAPVYPIKAVQFANFIIQ